MTGFRLVAMLSTYREGSLSRQAIISCLGNMDAVVVWEGPAGPERCDTAPATDSTPLIPNGLSDRNFYYEGEWSTDAAKRDAMIQWAKQQWYDKPLWVLWLDGDETLIHGNLLRDTIQKTMWDDEHRGATILDPDNRPAGGIPICVVDGDGNVVRDRGRLIRADYVRKILVANLVYELVTGDQVRLGHVPLSYDDLPLSRAISILTERGEQEEAQRLASLVYLPPPLPGEPHIVHRAHLRHPARQTLRLHQQEHAELERLGLPTG